ncbi:MAG: type II toxin-antitoxin system HicA family toxin [Candidatus Methanospirareceae archaeon]
MKVLEKKGFVLDRIKGSHHVYYQPETKRRAIIPPINRICRREHSLRF